MSCAHLGNSFSSSNFCSNFFHSKQFLPFLRNRKKSLSRSGNFRRFSECFPRVMRVIFRKISEVNFTFACMRFPMEVRRSFISTTVDSLIKHEIIANSPACKRYAAISVIYVSPSPQRKLQKLRCHSPWDHH